MQVSIDPALLREALPGCFTSRSIEILEHARLECHGQSLTLRSNDSLKESIIKLPATIKTPGQATARPGDIKSVLLGMDEPVDIESKEVNGLPHLFVRQKNGKGQRQYKLQSLNAADFPAFEEKHRKPWRIDVEALRHAISTVAYAAPKDDSRPQLNGVHIGEDYVCATNGHRLAAVEMPTGDISLIIPADAVPAVLNMLNHDKVVCSYYSFDNGTHVSAVGFASELSEITVRVLDYKYVDARRIFNQIKKAEKKATVNRELLLAALERMAALNQRQLADKTSSARVAYGLLNFEGERVFLATRTSDDKDYVPLEEACDEFGFHLNYLYVIALLRALKCSEVQVQYVDESAPLFFTPPDSDNEYHLIIGAV